MVGDLWAGLVGVPAVESRVFGPKAQKLRGFRAWDENLVQNQQEPSESVHVLKVLSKM